MCSPIMDSCRFESFPRHAGVWTVEETTRMCRDKMIRLRSLYIAQFKRLQHVLKERKRKYCQAIQAEEEEETGKQLAKPV